MTRGEKIGGLFLGLALFAGLFYLIYDSFLFVPYQELETEPFMGGLETTAEPGLEEIPAATEEETTPAEGAPVQPGPAEE